MLGIKLKTINIGTSLMIALGMSDIRCLMILQLNDHVHNLQQVNISQCTVAASMTSYI